MTRSDSALHRLEVVALLHALRNEAALGRDLGPFERRQLGLQFGRTHIGPDDAAMLGARIAFELDALPHAGLFRLGREIDALPGDVVFPAVIGAAQTAFLVAPEPQR